MKRTLLILRHAKAEPAEAGGDDFARALTRRGERDAGRVGREMREHGWVPDLVLCSPAARTRATAEAVLEGLGSHEGLSAPGAIRYEDRLYNASRDALMQVLSSAPARKKRLLVIGHNPGLEEVVEYLAAEPPPRKSNGKLLTTATLACLETDAGWRDLGAGGARLAGLLRR